MTNDSFPQRIVSGGQTGVDRAALDVAIELGIPAGGWCPRGRVAEDGVIDARYPLQETPLEDGAFRTEWNVRDSSGTLVLLRGRPQGGTALTIEICARLGKPCLVVDAHDGVPGLVLQWLRENEVRVLNVAGPRESEAPGIAVESAHLLRRVLSPPA